MSTDLTDRRIKDLVAREVDVRSAPLDHDPMVPIFEKVACRRRARRARGVGLAAAVLVVLVAVFVRVLPHDDPIGVVTSPTSPDAPTGTASPSTTPTPTPPLGPVVTNPTGIEQLPEPPIATSGGAAVVWTGSEVVVWSGQGAALDLRTRIWRTMSASPLNTTDLDNVVSAATEQGVLIVVGRAGAVWDSATNSWRSMPAAPGDVYDLHAAGGELISLTANAAFDPVARSWRALPTPPLKFQRSSVTWTGTELVVVGGDGTPFNGATAQAYDPRSNEWRRLPDPPVDLHSEALGSGWDGKQLVVVNYDMRAVTYDPATETWSDLPDVPARFSEGGTRVLSQGGVSVALTPNAAVFLTSDHHWVPRPYGPLLGYIAEAPSSSANAGTIIVWSTRAATKELNAIDLNRYLTQQPTLQVGLAAVFPPVGYTLADTNYTYTRTLPIVQTVDARLIGPAGATCELQSSYRPGGQSPPQDVNIVESIARSGGGPVTWRRDSSGTTWWTAPNGESDAFMVRCGNPSAGRAIAESAAFE